MPAERTDAIAGIVREEIAVGNLPGAVVVQGVGERIMLRQAIGESSAVPVRAPATVDTIYNAASLTKVMATTAAILQLV